MINRILPAEWYPQSFVQLTWPHINSDWHDDIEEVIFLGYDDEYRKNVLNDVDKWNEKGE